MRNSIGKRGVLALLLMALLAAVATSKRSSLRESANIPHGFTQLRIQPITKKTIQIISYNVYMRPRALWMFRDGQRTRARLLPGLVGGADVLVLQEAFDKRSRQILFRGLERAYPYRTKMLGRARFPMTHGGVFVLSRWPILRQAQHLYSQCAWTDCLATKGVVYARIKKPGMTFGVFATHTQAHSSKRAQQVRRQQFAELARLVRQQRSLVREPVFLVGDLNVDRLRSQREFGQMLKTLGARMPSLRGLPSTLNPGANPLASGRVQYLDYALYVPGLLPMGSKAWQASVALRSRRAWRKGVFDLSDHYAVYGYFVLP